MHRSRKCAHRPVAAAAGDPMHEIARAASAPSRRMHHLGVEHQPHRSRRFSSAMAANGAFVGGADAPRSPAAAGDAVAMAHPDRVTSRPSRQTPSNRSDCACDDLEIGAAELAVAGRLDLAAELRDHRLLAVADAEHRHAGVETRSRRARRARIVHARRAAGEDDRLRLQPLEGFIGRVERERFRE